MPNLPEGQVWSHLPPVPKVPGGHSKIKKKKGKYKQFGKLFIKFVVN